MNSTEKIPICVFAKPPRPGEAKTRLAPAVGAIGAAMFAQSFFNDTWESVSSLEWARPIVACTESFSVCSACEVWLQGEGDLGARLENVLRRGLRESTAAVALGADSPGLPLRYLEEAREAFATTDAVLGPSEDGGFYLIGLKSCPDGLLSSIRWSQPDTYSQTLSRLHSASMRVTVLEPWFDVDTPDDLRRLHSLIESKTISAPHTSEAFKKSCIALRV